MKQEPRDAGDKTESVGSPRKIMFRRSMLVLRDKSCREFHERCRGKYHFNRAARQLILSRDFIACESVCLVTDVLQPPEATSILGGGDKERRDPGELHLGRRHPRRSGVKRDEATAAHRRRRKENVTGVLRHGVMGAWRASFPLQHTGIKKTKAMLKLRCTCSSVRRHLLATR